jgi:hypothetical protein
MKRLNRNLCPLALFFWKIFMCTAAPIMNRTMKTVCAGKSTLFTGAPPNAHVVGGYGGFMFAYTLSTLVNCVQLPFNSPLIEVCRPAPPLYQTINLRRPAFRLLVGCRRSSRRGCAKIMSVQQQQQHASQGRGFPYMSRRTTMISVKNPGPLTKQRRARQCF